MKKLLNDNIHKTNKFKKSKLFGMSILTVQVIFFTVFFGTTIAFGLPEFSTLTTLIVTWTRNGGCVVAFIGAVMAIMGFKDEDPGMQIKGIKTCIAGIAIVAIAQGASAWM